MFVSLASSVQHFGSVIDRGSKVNRIGKVLRYLLKYTYEYYLNFGDIELHALFSIYALGTVQSIYALGTVQYSRWVSS